MDRSPEVPFLTTVIDRRYRKWVPNSRCWVTKTIVTLVTDYLHYSYHYSYWNYFFSVTFTFKVVIIFPDCASIS